MTVSAQAEAIRDEINAAIEKLKALTGPAGSSALDHLDELLVESNVESEDRVLRVVRRLCHEYEAVDLWQRIACEILALDKLPAADDRRYRPQALSQP